MGSVVRKVEAKRAAAIRGRLEADGWEFGTTPYARWSAKGPGLTAVYYDSGKLVVQGKHADDFFATFFDELGVLDGCAAAPADARDAVTEPIVGVDESGKGDYFGPLVVAAMLVRPEDVPVLAALGVRDSKTVGDGEVFEIERELRDGWPRQSHVVTIGPEAYNRLHREFRGNLNLLLAWGHAQAAESVLKDSGIACARMISDQFGHERLVRDALAKKKLELRFEQRPRAESHPAVAAASVLARAGFLRALRRLGEQCGHKLPKGAGAPVDPVARDVFREGGLEALGKVAKLHFRNTGRATGG